MLQESVNSSGNYSSSPQETKNRIKNKGNHILQNSKNALKIFILVWKFDTQTERDTEEPTTAADLLTRITNTGWRHCTVYYKFYIDFICNIPLIRIWKNQFQNIHQMASQFTGTFLHFHCSVPSTSRGGLKNGSRILFNTESTRVYPTLLH